MTITYNDITFNHFIQGGDPYGAMKVGKYRIGINTVYTEEENPHLL